MKKTILFLLCAMALQVSVAQRSAEYNSTDRLFNEGQAMFKDRNFAGCVDKITEYKKQKPHPTLIQEADFLLAACDYHQGKSDSELILREFLDSYPQTSHRNEIAFMLGSVYFKKENYRMAEYWFKQSNINLLSESEQADYAYRMGLIQINNSNYSEAKRSFGLLNQYSEKYKAAASYYLAYIAYKEGDYDLALERFTPLKSNTDYKSDVLYYIVQIYFAQKRYAQTVQEGQSLLNNDPQNEHNAEIERIIGISCYQQTHYQQAIQYLKPLADNPKGLLEGKDYYLLGLSYYQLQNYAQAILYLNQSNPANDTLGQSAYIYLGQSYLKTGDTNHALLAFESASRMDFDALAQEAALYNYAMLLHQNSVSGFGESITVLEKFINTYPQSVYAEQVNDALIDVYLTTNNYTTAIHSIAKINHPNRKILEAKQKIYYYLGTVDFTNENYPQAIENFTQAIASGDYAPDEKQQSFYWRGESHYKQGHFPQASSDFHSFLAIWDGSDGHLPALASYNLGYCAFKQAQYTEAQSFFQTFIRKEQKQGQIVADAYTRLGDCYFNQRQFGEAATAYNQSIAIYPATGDYALFQKGYVMGLQKDYNGKVAQMDKLLKDYPDSPYRPDALYEKGRSYVLLNNSSAAIDTYQNLLSHYPNSQWARSAGLQTGLLYYNANQTPNAITAYKKVITQYPESSEAKEALQDLKSIYVDLNDLQSYADYVKSVGGTIQFEISEQDSLTYLVAERLFQKGDKAKAQTAFIHYLKSFPQGASATSAHYYLANLYFEQQKPDLAQQEYAFLLNAGNTQYSEEAIGRTAEIQYNQKEYKAAMESYNQLKNTAATKTNRDAGALGVLRSAAQLNEYYALLNAANELLKDNSVNPEIKNEAQYHRAKSYWELGEKKKAQPDLSKLAQDTRTVYGAEAKYLLAQYAFETNNSKEAKLIIQDYAKQGTPHEYWLAKSFILLADIYVAENNPLQARLYLESLQTNYKKTTDEIQDVVRERLAKLARE
ncbi:MAG: tetratricopeptide repeat protein [Candidatus Symbiothrix sp.]|jgi:TolA-binding protein|nr:tetratricopeptide repeat protein [Candidatus Symbiothrix sp.]